MIQFIKPQEDFQIGGKGYIYMASGQDFYILYGANYSPVYQINSDFSDLSGKQYIFYENGNFYIFRGYTEDQNSLLFSSLETKINKNERYGFELVTVNDFLIPLTESNKNAILDKKFSFTNEKFINLNEKSPEPPKTEEPPKEDKPEEKQPDKEPTTNTIKNEINQDNQFFKDVDLKNFDFKYKEIMKDGKTYIIQDNTEYQNYIANKVNEFTLFTYISIFFIFTFATFNFIKNFLGK